MSKRKHSNHKTQKINEEKNFDQKTDSKNKTVVKDDKQNEAGNRPPNKDGTVHLVNFSWSGTTKKLFERYNKFKKTG